jgi:uncharacterized protein HemY
MLYFPYPGEVAGEWAEAFSRARAEYREGKFAEAEKVFRELAAGGLAPSVADLFARRCAQFVKEPPEREWAGIWDFVSK